MPDPGGKGIYYVNGRLSGSLTAYHVDSKQSTEIVPYFAEAARNDGGAIISRDGERVMYVTTPAWRRFELWTSDIDGGNKVKIASSETLEEELHPLNWAPDDFHLSFSQGSKLYIVGADRSGLRQLPSVGGSPFSLVWSPDQKSVYVSAVENSEPYINTTWKWSDGLNPEKLVDKCGFAYDADPGGKYLLALSGNGVYEVSISERNCVPLLPGVTDKAIFAPDGKSLLYAVASHREVVIYRQPWKDGKVIGTAQVAFKLPFTFSPTLIFSRDLSTIVYGSGPLSGSADLYLLSQ